MPGLSSPSTSESVRQAALLGSPQFDQAPVMVESTVTTGPSPAATGTTLTPANAALFPDPATNGPFDVIVYAAADAPAATTVEIVRVVSLAGSVWTIERALWSSPTLAIAAGYELRYSVDGAPLDVLAYLTQTGLVDKLAAQDALIADQNALIADQTAAIAAQDAAISAQEAALDLLSDKMSMLKRTIYTGGSGTHTYDAKTVTVNVKVCGAGGTGGSANGPGVGTATAGGGGGGGGVAEKMFARGSDNSCTYNFAGGVTSVDPGAAAVISGGAGGAGTVGTAAPGGVHGGAGGTASGGNMNQVGQAGGIGQSTGSASAVSGSGGSSVMGGGGGSGVITTAAGSTGGNPGGNYGGGGSGAACGSSASRAGGTGAPGIAIIDEYGYGV